MSELLGGINGDAQFTTAAAAFKTINKVPDVSIDSGDLRAGIGFHNQCAHWWRKLILQSARRPEIREDF